ncbi:hypothetical protein [Tepidanaerobacter sp. EBM-38]|uniref:hypothetical protein n=1 Tax=Tepidanaerobacter sp. EBM-38 TaxID=1918496 RepID=UPI000AFC4116|nr:hypothetical protein [Tepidanaerobacter sp. EBM-38]
MEYGLIILLVLLIIFLEVPSLIQKKLWRELTAFFVLLAVGFVLSILQIMNVKIPSPNDGIIFIIEAISKKLK